MDNNNNPPLVVIEPQVVPILERKRFLDMFTVRDIDLNSTVERYQFRDNSPTGGNFVIGDQVQPANVWHEVPFQQVGSVGFVGASGFARDGFSVRVFDGEFWSNVTTSVITSGNVSPIVQTSNGRVSAFDTVPISRFVNFTDGDNDPAKRYQFFDDNDDADGGRFLLRGVELPQRQFFTIEGAEIGGLTYRGAVQGRVEELISVRAFDGFSWSEFSQFQMATTTEPIVVQETDSILINRRRHASVFFSVSDQDLDDVRFYVVLDRRSNSDGGYWEFQGERMPSGDFFTVPAADFSQLFYVGGSTGPQQEEVWIQVFDGFQFSDITKLTIKTVTPPTISGRDAEVQAGHFLNFSTGGTANRQGQVPAGTAILDFADADGDQVTDFLVRDHRFNGNGGYFLFKGDRLPSGPFFRVLATELDQLEYVGGIVGPQQEQITALALANGVWSAPTTFTIKTLENRFRPTVQLGNVTARTGGVQRLDSMFSWADLDGDILQSFSWFDTGDSPDSGFFAVNGVRQNAKTWITLPFDEISTVKYHLSDFANTEKIRLTVSDGRKTSVLATSTITSVAKPVIDAVANDVVVDTLDRNPVGIPAGTLIQKVDNGPAYIQYQVYDESFDQDPLAPPADRSGRLFLRTPGAGNNGEELQGGVVHTLTSEEFSRLDFQGSEQDFGRQTDPFLVRADNGVTGWTEWERINVNTDPVAADALTSGTQWFNAGNSPGDATVVEYMFIDGNNTGSNYPPVPTYYVCTPQTDPDDECNVAGEAKALNQPQREAIREALNYMETVGNVDFVEVNYTADARNATMTFGAADLPPGVAAWAYFSNGEVDNGKSAKPGDVWFDTDPGNFDPDVNFEAGLGSAFRFTAYHEIGHAVGFKHPFDGDPVLSIFSDFSYNTVMSYSQDSVHNPLGQSHPEQPSTFSLWDNVELQNLYGDNTTHRPDNDHYGNFFSGSYPHFISNDESHQTVLNDTGGFDTFNYSNHTADESIDLRQGQFSTVNGVPLTVRIQYGTVIENARGGAGNDTIRGNETPNLLFGNAGDDILRAGGDNDINRGGAGADTYIWSLGDGRDLIREEGNGGIDSVEFYDPSGSIDSLEDDFVFRRFGDNLRIDLTLDQGEGQGTFTIVDYANTGSDVELMRFHGLLGTQIGGDIDLTSIFNSATANAQRYTVTDQVGQNNGFIAVPI